MLVSGEGDAETVLVGVGVDPVDDNSEKVNGVGGAGGRPPEAGEGVEDDEAADDGVDDGTDGIESIAIS